MSERKPKEVEYYDPDGKTVTGWYLDGHVYQDAAASKPIPTGSTFRAGNGNYYRMTPYGGVLWAAPKQESADGSWIPQGNHWYRTAQDLTERLEHRAGFSYDPEQDPLYRGARNQYLRDGGRAMEDSLGRAAALTGGYSSTYAQAVGQQAYGERLTALAELLPEFYDRAAKRYDSETRELLEQIGAASGLYDLDYQRYLDRLSRDDRDRAYELDRDRFNASLDQWAQEYGLDRDRCNASLDQWAQEFGLDRDRFNASLDQWAQEYGLDRDRFEASLRQWAEEFGLDRERFEASLEQWASEFAREGEQWEAAQNAQGAEQAESAAARERSYAYRMAILALRQGLPVSEELLQTAGIDPAYADLIRRWFASRVAS